MISSHWYSEAFKGKTEFTEREMRTEKPMLDIFVGNVHFCEGISWTYTFLYDAILRLLRFNFECYVLTIWAPGLVSFMPQKTKYPAVSGLQIFNVRQWSLAWQTSHQMSCCLVKNTLWFHDYKCWDAVFNSGLMSRHLINNIQRFNANKCWNAIWISGFWLVSHLAFSIPSNVPTSGQKYAGVSFLHIL